MDTTAKRRSKAAPATPDVAALDQATPVPTPTGSVRLADLRPGDRAFGSDGTIVRIAGLSEPLRNHACFEIGFSTGERLITNAAQTLVTELRDRSHRRCRAQPRSVLDLEGSISGSDAASFAVRVVPPIQLPDRVLPLNPYHLGVWLALSAGTGPVIEHAGPGVVEQLRKRLVQVYPTLVQDSYWLSLPTGAGLARRNFKTRLQRLDVLGRPHIPAAFLRAGEGQRRELLAGLLDAAGTVRAGGEVLFGTRKSLLAHGTAELVASLGIRPLLTPGPESRVSFVAIDRVFGLDEKHVEHQARRHFSSEVRMRRFITSVRPIASRPLRALWLQNDEDSLLVGSSFIAVQAERPAARRAFAG